MSNSRRAYVGVKDVAAAAGVSVGTVSNVLNNPDKVSADTADKVQAAIERLGFVRNDAARQLRAGHSTTIGLVVLDVSNPFFTDVARGAERRAGDEGLSILLGNSAESPERESAYIDLFEQQQVEGLLIAPIGDPAARLARLQGRGTPAVLVDRHADHPDFSSVSVDDIAGGSMATEHLIDGGRRRIAFIGGPVGLRQVDDRLAGARKAVAAAGDASVELIEIEALTIARGRAAAERLLQRDAHDMPDAVFAANDLVAVGVVQAFGMHGGPSIPGDVAIIGYDDIDFAQATVVPLTSIRQPRELLGRTAVELLMKESAALIAGDVPTREHVVFQPELVVRASTTGTLRIH